MGGTKSWTSSPQHLPFYITQRGGGGGGGAEIILKKINVQAEAFNTILYIYIYLLIIYKYISTVYKI